MRKPWLPSVPLTRLHVLALIADVWAQQLQITDLVLPVVAQRHDVVHLEPEMMRLVETTTRANAPLRRAQRYPHRLRHVLALIADAAPASQ